MTYRTHRFTLAVLAIGATRIAAQQAPPLRPLGPIVHVSKELLGSVSAVRQLPGGGLLINDIAGRKLVLFDSSLDSFRVVADSTPATSNAYGSKAAGLIVWTGDSTLFVDPQSLSMLVIDPSGKPARVMATPRASDVNNLVGGPAGVPALDAAGRLYYRAEPRFGMTTGPEGMMVPVMADTAPLIRYDLAARKLDTVAFLHIPRLSVMTSTDVQGRPHMSVTRNPLPIADDWALLAGGAIAVLRAQDYHLDWVQSDGSRRSTGKIPFDWKRLSDDDKVAFIDSARVAMQRLLSPATSPAAGTAGATSDSAGAQRGAAPSQPSSGSGAMTFSIPTPELVAPSELPDYAPPFSPGAARADLAGNLWVRTSNVVRGGSEYHVISASGELLDRIVLPTGRVIAGFGRGGVVFMGVRDGGGVRVEAAHVR